MKLSDFSLVETNGERLALESALYGDVAAFPADHTLHDLFEKQVKLRPDAIAIEDNNGAISYKELAERSDAIATFLLEKLPQPRSIVGLVMNNSSNAVISILGILKAGATYLPINPALPYDRKRTVIEDSNLAMLIYEKKYVRDVQQLQWHCPHFTSSFCINSRDIFKEDEEQNQLMSEELWDMIGDSSGNVRAMGGWLSSYTGETLGEAEMKEYAANIATKLAPYVSSETRILEIGCSSGISLLELAPKVKEYVGTDLSSVILEKTRVMAASLGLSNVRLCHLPAHKIHKLEDRDFDIVIINSVVQNFNGLNYLRKVLTACTELLKPKGLIFCGDIQDLDRKDVLVADLQAFRTSNPQYKVRPKTDWSNELFVSKGFFVDLPLEIPAISNVSLSAKIGEIENELTRFRYDVILDVNRHADAPAGNCETRHKFHYDLRHLSKFATTFVRSMSAAELPAYVLYTSGSTGVPKGCLVSHRNVISLVINDKHQFNFKPDDVWVQAHSCSFDVSVWEIFGSLTHGAKLVIPDNEQLRDIHEFHTVLRRNKVNVLTQTPSGFRYLMETTLRSASKQLGHLRYVVFAGERLEPAMLKPWVSSYPVQEVQLINMYGITETTIHSTFYRITSEDIYDARAVSRVGLPVPNTNIFVFDDEMKPAAPGVKGELYVGGMGVSLGYLNRPCLTAERFVKSPYDKNTTLYKSGDIGRVLPDGFLDVIGRLDNQIKVRGFRVEIGEVEATLSKHPEVNACCVVAKTDLDNEKRIIAYYTSDTVLAESELKNYLSQLLPDYSMPVAYVQIDKLPLNHNNKVNKVLLPEPTVVVQTHEPKNPIEEKIAAIWCQVLGRPTIGVNENFFDVGGHSLKATRIISQIYDVLSVRLSLKDIFANPSIARIARLVEQSERLQWERIDLVEEQDYYRLSHGQRRLWILDQIIARRTVYNMFDAFMVEDINPEAFISAVECLVQCHESLRTRFVTVGGVPFQKVLPWSAAGLSVRSIDLTNDEHHEQTLRDIIQSTLATPFNLANDALLAVKLIKIESKKHVIVFNMHHIVSDGWSVGVFLKHLFSLYDYFSGASSYRLVPPAIQYKDFSGWQTGKLMQKQFERSRKYWLNQFSGEVPALHLPVNYPYPEQRSHRGGVIRYALDKEIVSKINEISTRLSVTPFIFLLASLKALLYHYGRQQNIVVGIPTAGRDHPGLEEQIGFFVNTLALKTEIASEDTFRDLLYKVRKTTLAAHDHQIYPFDSLVEELKLDHDRRRNPLFDVMLVVQNTDLSINSQNFFRSHDVTPYAVEATESKYDLVFSFVPSENEMTATIEFNSDIFESSRVREISNHFHRLTKIVSANLDIQLDAIGYFDESLPSAGFDFSKFPTNKSLVDLFEEAATSFPDAIAVIDGERSFTYRFIQERARCFESWLQHYQIRPEDRIGVQLPQDEVAITCILGILMAGGAYVPIDTEYPDERVNELLSNSDVKLLITSNDIVSPACPCISPGEVFCQTGSLKPIKSSEVKPENLAYIIYTSGSTGTPKGVMVEHRNVVSLLRGDGLPIRHGRDDTWTLFHSICFDFSVWEIFCPLTTGGRLVTLPREVAKDHVLFARLLVREKVTVLNQVPGVFKSVSKILTEINREAAHALRYVIFGGDKLAPAFLERWHNEFPHVKLINMYGITETTVHVTYKELSRADISSNLSVIGKPLSTLQIRILDQRLSAVPDGVEGEIFVFGAGVARGYVNQVEQTSSKFLQRWNGFQHTLYRSGDLGVRGANDEIEFRGRGDQQVKIRGHRIEIGEVEYALKRLPEVADAVVVARRESEEGYHLIAYVVLRVASSAEAIRTGLSYKFPLAYIPSYFVFIESVPLTQNGKIDRNALPAPEEHQKTMTFIEAPGNTREEAVRSIWAEVLGRNDISVTADFFQIGGHSLRAMLVIARIHERMGMEITLKDFFLNPTIRLLSTVLRDKKALPLAPAPILEYYALSPSQREFWLLQEKEKSGYYNVPMAFSLHGVVDIDALKHALERVVARHEMLRTTYVEHQGSIVQKVHAPTDVRDVLEIRVFDNSYSTKENILDFIRTDIQSEINLKSLPIFRAVLFREHEGKYILFIVLPHIACDEWSLKLIARDLVLLYNEGHTGRPATCAELSFQYKDFLYWQNQNLDRAADDEALMRWKTFISDSIPLQLPYDFKEQARQKSEGSYLLRDLGAGCFAKVSETCTAFSVTSFISILSFLKIFLSRTCGQNDISVGVPISGRQHHPALEHIVGPFLNTLLIRTQIAESDTFAHIVRKVKESTTESFRFQDYPFSLLLGAVKEANDPLFNVMVVVTDDRTLASDAIPDMVGLTVQQFPIGGAFSKYDLTYFFTLTTDTLIARIEYDTSRFMQASIELMMERLMTFIQRSEINSRQLIGDYRLTSETEEKLKSSNLFIDFDFS